MKSKATKMPDAKRDWRFLHNRRDEYSGGKSAGMIAARYVKGIVDDFVVIVDKCRK